MGFGSGGFSTKSIKTYRGRGGWHDGRGADWRVFGSDIE